MKQVFLSILLMLLPVVANAQEPVLEYDGELYFIPAPLTKEGKPFLYSRANGSITVYDENFNKSLGTVPLIIMIVRTDDY